MYPDPKRVREPYARVRLDQYEARVIDALVDYTGLSRAELVRQLLMNEALDVLGVDLHEANVAPHAANSAGLIRPL